MFRSSKAESLTGKGTQEWLLKELISMGFEKSYEVKKKYTCTKMNIWNLLELI